MTFPHQQTGQRVRSITLQVETLPDGLLRVSTPQARGWAGTARNPVELARIVEQAYREVSVASYARQRGAAYDLDQLTMHVPGDSLAHRPMQRQRAPQGARVTRAQVHDPGAWARMEDGKWQSPSGRAYRADTVMVQRVIARRVAKGLPV